MSDPRSLVIHAHLYQPPRENPWTGVVEVEPNAAPFHDWNARITAECYTPLTAARVERPGEPVRTVNLLESMSFDVGATLLVWLEQEAPATYEGMLAADRASRARTGHGGAIAAPYHHVILPLASRRDKRSEVRWGLADFRRRFGRDAAGFWLPETAVDHETLDVLAEEGVAFTILAPHQVAGPAGDGLPRRYRASRGRTVALFTYDGALSHGVAFGGLLHDARVWAAEVRKRKHARVVSVATDGETYGHHHRFGDLALLALLDTFAADRHVRVENFASVLAAHPPAADATLVAPSSWSCVHGVGRWRTECGCRITGGTQQRWRAPLREAIAWLAAEVDAIFAREWPPEEDPWEARDALARPWVEPTAALTPRQRELLAMARNALRAFTSCGWFFDDFGGLEGRQVLRYAARAIALAGPDAPRLEAGLLARLAEAPSNDPAIGTARDFYLAAAKPPA
jgi:hypothetical protein